MQLEVEDGMKRNTPEGAGPVTGWGAGWMWEKVGSMEASTVTLGFQLGTR